ncbi:hypothetical protein [Flavobacterium polysaccharolyticum]|uniref:Uncharacterized protein n=1 Tax=Flavobacterium polysaccharolyticum TaxID=3133148 RepID=A0ABU9NSR0_9FLAO
MKTVSLKIDDSIFGETEKILSKISIQEIDTSTTLLNITTRFKKDNF